MAGNSPQEIGARIVNLALEPVAFAEFCRRCPFLAPGIRTKASVAHPERLEDLFLRKLIERHASKALHQLTEHDVTNVAVNEARSRLDNRRQPADIRERSRSAACVISFRVVGDQA